MAITAAIFPPPLRAYNFTLTGNPTANLVAEAEYLLAQYSDRLCFMPVGLNCSIGMVCHATPVPVLDLSPLAALPSESHSPVPTHRNIADPLSYPKVLPLLRALRAVWRAEGRADAFRRAFFDMAGAPYRCEDGDTARDFDTINYHGS